MRRAAILLTLLTGCATTSEVVPDTWLSVPRAPAIRAVQLDAAGKVTTALQPRRESDIRVEGNRIYRGDKPLSPGFEAIESFDVSESRGEVAFSAKRGDNFDVGLVSTDGSPVSWIPPETADEVNVHWAPRGNKVAFVVRLKNGDFVRTVHIPTAAQLSVDFEGAKIETLGWDPNGDRFAVAYSTPDASDRVEVMTYSGTNRKMVLKPAEELPIEVASFAPDAVSLRPREIEYNEKLPLVIWIDDDPFAWNDARADLMRNARVAVIVTRRLSDAIWAAGEGTPWIDATRTFVVNGRRAESPPLHKDLLITADPKLPPRRYRRTGTTVAVAPDVVQSFAARFIADALKRTGPPNGSSQ
jgi:hypothetical protein